MNKRAFLIIRYCDTRKTVRKWCASVVVALAELCMLESNADITEIKIEIDYGI